MLRPAPKRWRSQLRKLRFLITREQYLKNNASAPRGFYGWRVVHAAFVMAVFGWGLGFYGPPVFLAVIHETRGWTLALISAAISVHFAAGAITGGNLPALHRRYGIPRVSKAGACAMAAGMVTWGAAGEPWQLFITATLSGTGWGTMSAAALNAVVSPWFNRGRPMALGMAYNGGSVGGIIFSPLWVAAIHGLGFPLATSLIAGVMLVTLWVLAEQVFSRTPAMMGVGPDGGPLHVPPEAVALAPPLPGARLWRDRRFVTLCLGMMFGLFAQIGLIAHLYSLLVPALGARDAGWAMGLVTLMAIVGRTMLGWLMPAGADRRLVACAGYAMQIAGSIALMLAAGTHVPLLLAGVMLFGLGFGNATSLPPLIAQVEFAAQDVQRAAALVVAIAQGGYAIAPAFFGVIREFTVASSTGIAAGSAPAVFATAAVVQCLAVIAFLAGRRGVSHP